MTESELLTAIEQYEADAESLTGNADDRIKALDYYLGEPRGDEVDGRSKVISRDVFDTVEWIKPQIAEIFCSGEEVVSFAPRGPDDVQAAEQETEFVNWIVTQKNNWFEIFSGWQHDALIQKVGYVKAYWDDSEDVTEEDYKGIDEAAMAKIASDPYVQITELESYPDNYGVMVYNVKVSRRSGCAHVRIESVPPENIKISRDSRQLSLQDKRQMFVEHVESKTISELRAMGFDVADDINDGGESAADWEANQRDENNPLRESVDVDPASRRVKVRECWIRFDSDDDGIAELRRCIVVGTDVLLNETSDLCTIIALCPNILPHQHSGLSVADAVMDLQDLGTALLRGSLDNLYLANNGRFAIDVNAVNLDDFLTSRPGGVVRTDGNPNQLIMPLTHSTGGLNSLPMLDYLDKVKQRRTGVNEQTQGLNPNALNNTATGAQMLMTAAMQRIKFIARTFAETGARSLFQVVHALSLKHSRGPEIIRLRGQWVPVDPREWVKRSDLVISVGLGTGDKPQQIAFMDGLIKRMVEMQPFGLSNPATIYNAVKKYTQLAGYKDVDSFWLDPATQPPKPQQPPLPLVIEDMKIKGQMQIAAGDAQVSIQSKRAELELQAANDARDAERQREKAQLDFQLEQQRIAAQRDIKVAELQAQAIENEKQREHERLMKELDVQAKLAVANISDQRAAAGQEINRLEKQPPPVDLSPVNDAVNVGYQQLAQSVVGLHQMLNQVASMVQEVATPKPARIIRNAAGKAIAIERGGQQTVIERDSTGKVIGI